MMIYGSMQGEFVGTRHNGQIQRYGTPIFGDIVVDRSKPINNDDKILWGDKI